jgi:hypothetical protein
MEHGHLDKGDVKHVQFMAKEMVQVPASKLIQLTKSFVDSLGFW